MRGVADALGITGGLVGHYFPSVDGMLAEAFGSVASAEVDDVFDAVNRFDEPVEKLRCLLRLMLSDDRDRIHLLWLDAWHAGRRRPLLRSEVAVQMATWIDRVRGLIEDGQAAGVFTTSDASASAMRVLAIVDGITVQAVMRDSIDYQTVKELVFVVAEQELGLAPRTLA